MSDQTLNPELSIVIPFYNEAENVEPLYAELSAALGGNWAAATRCSSSMTAAGTTALRG